MEMPGWPANCESSAFQIARFRVREHLYQWYSISEIIRLSAAQYLEFLNNVLEKQLDVEVPLGEGIRRWYLHDGAPPYFARPVSE